MGRKNKKAMNKRRSQKKASKRKKRQKTKRNSAIQSAKDKSSIHTMLDAKLSDPNALYDILVGVDENDNPIRETITQDLLLRAVQEAFKEELTEQTSDPNSRFEIPIGTDEQGQTIYRTVSGPQLSALSLRDELWNDDDEMIDFSWLDELPVVE